jgi:hypothetical protein
VKISNQKDKSDSDDFVTRQLTTKAALFEGFFDRRNKILRDVGATRLIFKLKKTGKPYRGERLSTIDLVLASLDKLFLLKFFFLFFHKTSRLMRRLTVISLSLQLVSPVKRNLNYASQSSYHWFKKFCGTVVETKVS